MKNKIGKLFIVATPIGNLTDITLRALETLKEVDLILCEDTRVSSVLLRHYMINKPLLTYNDHSPESVRNKIIDKLKKGQDIALISDAGTPLISDPGYKLIQEIKSLDIPVHTAPGPCSVIAALSLAGVATDRFMFIGFLPHKKAGKEKIFAEVNSIKTTLVFFEAANRLLDSLALIKNYFAGRNIVVVREITKLFEQTISGSSEDIIEYYQDNPDKLRGEIVLIVGPKQENEEDPKEKIITDLTKLMKEISLRDAVEITASQYSVPKKQIYKLALSISD